MKKWALGAALFVTLTGCVNQAELETKRAEFERTRPFCYSERECEAKWVAAREWITRTTPWRLRVMTDSYMETYAGPPSTNLIIRVGRRPALGGYEFGIETRCNSILIPCHPNPYDAELDFNRTLNAVQTY